jgi:transposase-like protein
VNFGIRLYLAGQSFLYVVSIFESLGFDRHRSTMHRWVQKADLQPTGSVEPNHVAVDETVIQLNDERYWLYAAVDSDTNRLLHMELFSTRATADTSIFSLNSVRNIESMIQSSSSMEHRGCRRPVSGMGSDSSMLHMGIGMPLNVSFMG